MSPETKPVNAIRTNQLRRSAPYFVVADIEQSSAHYEHVLGDGSVLGFGQSLR